ncbi:phospholipid/cholesterol/gamma-HCH transport system substrate-binding protein [Rhodoblastus acidophilus]|uniref:MlaD family protein n=1 Tax=Rhodoblastus acidophilus TaxID=1074 RepID=UPI0022257425|nr:MlaD family protein [Rhodoblastus acidophilus]MCW2286004.1 phospholipid/cholesterol/gamma-HCH transport system substrate-binding protein [Rhodoblastus acidophilus]MCW2334898.1 phospholipid/cholesterol/gamma-HCH transport system substrate-binding protein [Rhodoblastus acidophilus]
METRANYALMGLFTLAVILGGFGFAWWFASSGKTTAMRSYQVYFTGSVSGLSTGAYVLFNGLRVGEVRDLGLRPDDPSKVYAVIEVDARTPVKADTRAQLEYTGLTGVASVALLGGAADAKPLAPNSVIDGAPSQMQDLMSAAQRLAGRIDLFVEKANQLVDANSDNLTATVKNVQAMTASLSEASDGIRNVVKAVDTAKLNSMLSNADSAIAKLNGLLGSGGGKTVLTDISDAAKSMRKLADSLADFSRNGLKQYESLAIDGRRTLESVDRAARRLEKDPQSLLFGPKEPLPEYRGR